jgi:hypothetical protein
MATDKKIGRIWLWVVSIFWAAAFVGLFYGVLVTIFLLEEYSSDLLLSRDIAWVIAVLCGYIAFSLSLVLLVYYIAGISRNCESMVNDLRRLLAGQTQNEAILTQINENQFLSDAVKAVAFREKDRSVVQEAIQQDIRIGNWDSALHLIQVLEEKFSGKQEALQMRAELDEYRNATIQEKIDKGIKHIESLWMIHHYEDAQKEVELLMRIYPQDERVQALEGQTDRRQQGHKKELLARWDKAVKSNDVEQGVELLKLLDAYLTPTEAAALEESARGVFKARLHNMGVQFSLFVTEREWNKALKLGKEIVEEFPNSRMAQEVRDKLPVLEQRAGSQ